MLRVRLAAAFVLLLALARCGVLPPFETVPPPLTKEQQTPGVAPPTQVSVCYNALTTTAAQVRGIATASCTPGTAPHAAERDLALNNCPLLQPERATFNCLKTAEPSGGTGQP
jgi:hypothetical protein